MQAEEEDLRQPLVVGIERAIGGVGMVIALGRAAGGDDVGPQPQVQAVVVVADGN